MRTVSRLSRYLLTYLLLTSGLHVCEAQGSLVSFFETISDPKGNPFVGEISFNATDGSGRFVSVQYSQRLSMLLAPGDYCVDFSSSVGGVSWVEEWNVADGLSSAKVSDVQVPPNHCDDIYGLTRPLLEPTGSSQTQPSLPISIAQVTSLGTDLASLSNSINSTTTQVNTLSSQANSLPATMTSLNSQLSDLSNRISSANTSLNALGPKVTSLGTRVDTLTAQTSPLPASVSSLKADTSDLASRIAVATSTLAGFSSSLQDLQARLVAATAQAASLAVQVSNLSAPVQQAERTFTYNEVPKGLVDGRNASFVLGAVPNPVGSLRVYRNGLKLTTPTDFLLEGGTLTFAIGAIPSVGDVLLASYAH
jgi:peptidoglycan hydrolase CwlO-like protein